MVYLSLYRKYRPQVFADILGQEHVSATLANAVSEGRVAHAYLFTGPRGTGKTSTARVLAKALNCERGPTPNPCGVCASCVAIAEGSSLDVIEMDAASHSKVEETREILAGVPLATAGGRKKVYVIDEVHMLSPSAFNALLKTLEEPPGHVVFVLATTEPHKVLPTIVSRTQRFDFRRVSADVIENHLAQVAKAEGMEVDHGAVAVVARHAEGSVRDALSALDQLASLGGTIKEDDAERLFGERAEDTLLVLFDAIAAGDLGRVFLELNSIVAQGADPRQLAFGALSHARSLLLLKTAPEADGLLDMPEEGKPKLAAQADLFTPGSLLRAMDLLSKAITEMRNAPNHRLLLEVALVRAAAPDTDPSATGLLGRIERLERRIGIEGGAPQPAPAEVARPTPQPPKERAVKRPPAAAEAPKTAPAEAPPEAAAESEESAAPAAVAAPSSADVGLTHIKDAWGATLKEVSRKSKRVWGLLSPSRPVQLDGSVLAVEVQSQFHQSSMAEDRNMAILSDALFAALGVKMDLRFVARGEEPSADDSSQAEDLSETRPVTEVEDPVELVKRGLSAEVVEEPGAKS